MSARSAFAAGLIAFGLTKLLAHLFLLLWAVASQGQSDIAARGPWLLALYLQWMPVVSFVLTLVWMAYLARDSRYSMVARLWPTILGAGIGGLLILAPIDPTAAVLRVIPWTSSVVYFAVSALVAMVIVIIGARLARRSVRDARSVADAPVAT